MAKREKDEEIIELDIIIDPELPERLRGTAAHPHLTGLWFVHIKRRDGTLSDPVIFEGVLDTGAIAVSFPRPGRAEKVSINYMPPEKIVPCVFTVDQLKTHLADKYAEHIAEAKKNRNIHFESLQLGRLTEFLSAHNSLPDYRGG